MKRYLREQVSSAVAALGLSGDAPPTFEKPRTAEHGDLTTNIALALAKACHAAASKAVADLLRVAWQGRFGAASGGIGALAATALGRFPTPEARDALELAVRRGSPLIQKASLAAIQTPERCR